MGYRFFRRVRILPGVTLNFSKHGTSVSVGPRGFKYTIGSSGVRHTVGIPGTGLYYTEHRSNPRGQRADRRAVSSSPKRAAGPAAASRLELGFFKRLVTPAAERHFVDGMHALVKGDDATAIAAMEVPDALPDASFMAGVLELKAGRHEAALRELDRAQANPAVLGTGFAKYGIDAELVMPITDVLAVHVGADRRGLALVRAEALQGLERYDEACAALAALHAADPEDALVILSWIEILVEDVASKDAWKQTVELSARAENTSEVAAAILYYKGKALRELGLLDAAGDALSLAARRKKDRPAALLTAIDYERGLVYKAKGQMGRALQAFGRAYAADPNYLDVAAQVAAAQ